MEIDLLPFLEYIIENLLIPLLMGGFLMLVNRLTGMQIEKKHSDALSQALEKGSDLVLSRMKAEGHTSMEISSAATAELVQYALDHTPDAIEHFKKSNPRMDLSRMATTRLVAAKSRTTQRLPITK